MKYTTVADVNANKHVNSRITVEEIVDHKYPSCVIRFCLGKCTCGNPVRLRLQYVISGATVSCGCKKREDTIRRNTKWVNNSRLIGQRYRAMLARCYDKGNKGYRDYGAKGVRVCEEWLNNYQSFVDWCNANGIAKEKDLDKDTKGDGLLYSPENCSFVDRILNRRYQPKKKNFRFNHER